MWFYLVPGGCAVVQNVATYNSWPPPKNSRLQRDPSQFLFQPHHPLVHPDQLGHKGLDFLHLQLLGPAAVVIEAPRHLASCRVYRPWKRRWERM